MKVPELITAKEASVMLKQNKPDKIYLLVRSGILSGFKFGKKWLIDKESVTRYIRGQLGYVSDTNSDTYPRKR